MLSIIYKGGPHVIVDKNILSLIGIPYEKVKAISSNSEGEFTFVYVELNDVRPICPYCHKGNIVIKDYYTTHINNSIVKHQKMEVEIRMRRYKCKDCYKTFKQDYPITNKRDSISAQVKQAIIEDLKDRLTLKQIADDHHVSPSTVSKIFDTLVLEEYAQPLSKIICIDEFCYKHGSKSKEGKYPAVITNPFTGDIIDIIESRWKAVLIEYFNKVKVPERTGVKYFVSDMNETYRSIKKIFFQKAEHIADRFHIIKAFNDAITTIRMRIIKEEVWEIDEYKYLKKNWKIFMKDRRELEKQRVYDKWGVVSDPTVELDKCLLKYPDLHYAYWTKEEFRKATRYPMLYKKAEEIFNFYENLLLKATIAELVKIGKMFTNWKTEIINGLTKNEYNFKISNAIAESTNNQIQTLIDLCYGMPNFKKMRKRVLYINRNRKNKKTREV